MKQTIRQLAIALLTSEFGINEESYNLLYDLLEGDEDITGHVDATDGGFYLPEGWKDERAGQAPTYGEFEAKVQALIPGADIQTDNGDQLVIYTGLMIDDGKIVDYVDPEDEEMDEDDEPQDEEGGSGEPNKWGPEIR